MLLLQNVPSAKRSFCKRFLLQNVPSANVPSANVPSANVPSARILLLQRNLLHATLMATALESCAEELVHDGLGSLVVDETTWENQYVGIVVLADEMGNLLAPSQTGTNALMLVQGHGDTLAAAADADARINLAALDALAKRMAEVWVIDALVTIGTVILDRITLLLQVLQHELLHWETCVVASYAYCLYFHNSLVLSEE